MGRGGDGSQGKEQKERSEEELWLVCKIKGKKFKKKKKKSGFRILGALGAQHREQSTVWLSVTWTLHCFIPIEVVKR